MALRLQDFDPYAGGQKNIYTDGQEELIARPYVRPSPPKFRVHTVTAGETLSNIAYQYYKDVDKNPSKWLELIAVDNEIEQQWDLTDYIGLQIRIPDLIQFKLSRRTTRTIKQNLARSLSGLS